MTDTTAEVIDVDGKISPHDVRLLQGTDESLVEASTITQGSYRMGNGYCQSLWGRCQQYRNTSVRLKGVTMNDGSVSNLIVAICPRPIVL